MLHATTITKSDFRTDDESITIQSNGDEFAVRRNHEQRGDFFCPDAGIKTFQNGKTDFQPLPVQEETGTETPQTEQLRDDGLILRYLNQVVYMEDGQIKGLAWLSNTQYQVVVALAFKQSGLSLNDLEPLVEKWAKSKDGVNEDTVRKTIDNINSIFLDGHIPFEVTSKMKDITENGRTLTKKIYFFHASTHDNTCRTNFFRYKN